MIQDRSLVTIADNSGARVGRIFKIPGSSKKRYAEIGEVVILSVQTAEPRKNVKKKDVLKAVIVRQRKPFRRKDGSYVRFDENAVVVIEGSGKNPKEPKAGRIFGPIPRELQELGYQTIISRAPEVV
ncbi:MAG: large subunit ribosomal protein [Patescibacteria group bacterium]|jgi:large subunit ribosomal protein L14|nr:large subunit ribosomal protein [Patescibacteria group bacterium]